MWRVRSRTVQWPLALFFSYKIRVCGPQLQIFKLDTIELIQPKCSGESPPKRRRDGGHCERGKKESPPRIVNFCRKYVSPTRSKDQISGLGSLVRTHVAPRPSGIAQSSLCVPDWHYCGTLHYPTMSSIINKDWLPDINHVVIHIFVCQCTTVSSFTRTLLCDLASCTGQRCKLRCCLCIAVISFILNHLAKIVMGGNVCSIRCISSPTRYHVPLDETL